MLYAAFHSLLDTRQGMLKMYDCMRQSLAIVDEYEWVDDDFALSAHN